MNLRSGADNVQAVARSMAQHGWELQTQACQGDGFKNISRILSGVEVIERRLGVCRGRRSAMGAGTSTRPFLAFSHMLSGRERGVDEGSEVYIEPGDTIGWNSTQSLEFEVLEPVHKLIFIIPEQRLGNVFPKLCSIRNVLIHPQGVGSFVAGHLATFAKKIDGITTGDADSIIDMTMEILARGLAGQLPQHNSTGDRLLTYFLEFAEKHLNDPSLCPHSIAAAHGVSIRYVHLLFACNNLTVSGWIRERRLRRCRIALESEGRGARVTEIAFRWGFKDPAHFSRLFKRRFGIAPTQIRRDARARIG